MSMKRRLLIGLLLLASLPAVGWAQAVPQPDFDHYQIPDPEMFSARWWGWAVVDVVVLIVALLIGTGLVLWYRRRWAIATLMIFSLLYFGFFRVGCVCSIGAVQNVSEGLSLGSAVPWTVVAFFLLPLIFALFFGRIFCAAVCPLGAVQDVVAVKPVRVPRWLEAGLGMFAWVYLAAAVLLAITGSAYLICRYDPFIALFRMAPIGWWIHMAGEGSDVSGQIGYTGRLDTLVLVLLGCVVLVGIFIARPYCRYLCPLGALLRVTSRLSWRHARITPAECIQCRLCEDSCPYNAINEPSRPRPAEGTDAERRSLGRWMLWTPAAVLLAAVLGFLAARPLSQMNYTVRLSERVWLEESGKVTGRTDDSSAFRAQKTPVSELYRSANQIRRTMAIGGAAAGGLLGLIFWLKVMQLHTRRRRTDYQPDRATCLSCGRCFARCPIEQQRRKGKFVNIKEQPND